VATRATGGRAARAGRKRFDLSAWVPGKGTPARRRLELARAEAAARLSGWLGFAKDLDSIDPEEREELWTRIESYMRREGMPRIRQTTLDELATNIGQLMTMERYRNLRNLGAPANVARKIIEDRRGREAAKQETASDEYAAEQVALYRRMRVWVNNLIMKNPRVHETTKRRWRVIRSELSKQENYWTAVLEYRYGARWQTAYRRLRRAASAARRAAQRSQTQRGRGTKKK